jgi:2-polyprenyl-3-methyl-5-hydroxy-6-metoxy-1,4-benzoquinol methylase
MQMTESYSPKSYWEDRLRRRFDLTGVGHIGFGPAYNRWLYASKRRCIEKYFDGVDLHGKSVLDVGCGTGFFVRWYLEKGASVTGIDITETSVARLREQFEAEFFMQDISACDYVPRRKYDVVNMWDVVYHIVDDHSYERVAENLAASMASGGVLLMTDCFNCESDLQIADHVKYRCAKTHTAALARAGFESVELHFLYNLMNRRISIPIVDDWLGALYYWLDGAATRIPANNLALSIWRYQG